MGTVATTALTIALRWLKRSSGCGSLKLIHVRSLELKVFAPGEAFGNTKRRVQARFAFDGVDYWLWVTDPMVERQYLAEPDGEYAVVEAYLTISIGEPYQDYCYKLVATVIGRT